MTKEPIREESRLAGVIELLDSLVLLAEQVDRAAGRGAKLPPAIVKTARRSLKLADSLKISV